MDSSTPSAPAPLTLAQRAKRELIRYLIISSYLYVCFGELLFYKAAILHSVGIPYTDFGLALAKALILGKFMLLAETFNFGGRARGGRLAVHILIKSLLFAGLLILLSFIEEVIVGAIHGKKLLDVLQNFGGGTLPQALATAFLMVLVMIPYFGFSEISAGLGKGALERLLFARDGRGNGAGEAA